MINELVLTFSVPIKYDENVKSGNSKSVLVKSEPLVPFSKNVN